MVSLLVSLLVLLLIAGLVIYVIQLLPIDGNLKQIGKVVVLIIVLIVLLQRFAGHLAF